MTTPIATSVTASAVVARLLRAEQLLRRRAPGEKSRAIASQRTGRVDPNPHQIDAVLFALERLEEGGCILADEVGLGKTIEAGLVLAQRFSEGARRALLIAPKPLLGQWRDELRELFEIETREVQVESGAFEGEGVFVVGREAAGGKALAGLLAKAPAFDLCIIDEAHEIFGGLHKRYDRAGNYRHDAKSAQIAGRVRDALGVATPTLLLTATPLQNSLVELWSLVQYVEPSGTLLGELPTFRARFAGGDDRQVDPDQADELRHRLSKVVQRTLRRQAQSTIDKPFVGRRARTFEFTMSPEERALYDDVTRYLLQPNLAAFRGSHRSLLLLGFHRRMASSKAALAASLRNVVARLERLERGQGDEGEATADAFLRDLDDIDDEIVEALAAEDREDEGSLELDVPGELATVRELAARAAAMTTDSKAQALLQAVRFLQDAGARGEGSGKAVIFTESRATQAYLRDLLVEACVCRAEEVTCFNGSNDDGRAREALARWEREVESQRTESHRNKVSRSVATRMALVHEFRTRSDVFIGTEAAAKGLNLQFCDALINYDLPWNPQRVEQRIGRVHRYGQERDVTVINFVGRDNAAQRLTYEILEQKLELFGQVMGASDEILGSEVKRSKALDDDERVALSSALAMEFERDLGRVYRQARSVEEIEEGLRRLRESTADRRDELLAERARTRSLIAERFDEAVQRVFRDIADDLPAELRALDDALARVARDALRAWVGEDPREERSERGRSLVVPEGVAVEVDGLGPLAGRRFFVGDARHAEEGEERLHLGHPIFRAARAAARSAARGLGDATLVLAGERAMRGRLVLELARYGGFIPSERVLVAAVHEGELGPEVMEPHDVDSLVESILSPNPEQISGAGAGSGAASVPRPLLEDALAEARFDAQGAVQDEVQARFERAMERLETFMLDRRGVLAVRRRALLDQLGKAEDRRDEAIAGELRKKAEREVRRLGEKLETLDEELAALDARELPRYQELRARALTRMQEPPRYERLLEIAFVVRDDSAARAAGEER